MVCTGKVQVAQPDQQVAACTAIIEAGQETPTNMAVAYCARGVAFHARDQLNRAIADYDESVRIGPKSPTGYRCRGYGNFARGALDEAISDFNEAIALDPNSASFLARGRAYRAKGDLSRAIADYDEALRLDPNNAMAFNNRAAALIQRQDSVVRSRISAMRSDLIPVFRRPSSIAASPTPIRRSTTAPLRTSPKRSVSTRRTPVLSPIVESLTRKKGRERGPGPTLIRHELSQDENECEVSERVPRPVYGTSAQTSQLLTQS